MNMTLIRERLFSRFGLHAAGFGLLAIAVIVLGVRVGLDWSATSGSSQQEMADRQMQLKTLQVQTAPLRGLDKRVVVSRTQIDNFYAKRVPPSYSAVLERLGQLQAKSQVQLSRVQYTPLPGSGDLTEIRMDAGLSGTYPAIMRFINDLERDQTFFVIRAMALTGQQNGTVNLRLQFSTWMRPGDAPHAPPAPATAPSGEGE